MQIACHRCGAAIEESATFCPQCGAAQIRVAPSGNVPATPPVTPGSLQPTAQPVMTPVSTDIDWHNGIRAAALAGLIAGVPSALPILSLGCCLWVAGGAALAVMFYQKNRALGSVVTAGMGVRLGAVTGVIAFGIYFALQMLSFAVFNTRGKMREAMLQAMRDSAARNPDPSAQQILERMSTPAGLATIIVVMVVVMFLAFVVFGIAGGAIGASIWGRKQQA